MTLEEILYQAVAMLQRRGRVAYLALKLQFSLDDYHLEALKDELLYAPPHTVDDDGRGLIWTGEARPTPTPGYPLAAVQEQAPLSYTPADLGEKILDASDRVEGERKQVTVLFADTKGSTELIRDLDPEAALQDCIEEIRRTRGLEVRIRVGLNSGEVVVRSIGNDLHLDYSAVGQTSHLAARMEQLAAPGSVRLTGATLRLIEGLMQVNALGPVPVKGLTEPVEVFELVGASGVRRPGVCPAPPRRQVGAARAPGA